MVFLCVNVHMCPETETQNKQTKKKKSEYGGVIKTMCFGQCHAAVGSRQESWKFDFAKLHLGSGFQSGIDKGLRLGQQRCMGEESLAIFGHGDVEIKFYIPSCFIVPFTREQVQGC